jgi:serine/threonine protein kinase
MIQVLLLTLQNEPPTLDRDSTKHRYSKSFKDMIDVCLQKDPLKRPTSEKLLQHPFFKQGKKSNYLVQSILANLGPIQNRAHNKSM